MRFLRNKTHYLRALPTAKLRLFITKLSLMNVFRNFSSESEFESTVFCLYLLSRLVIL